MYAYNFLLMNYLGDDNNREEVTFEFTSQKGTVLVDNIPRKSRTLDYGECKLMKVTEAEDSITLKIWPKTKKTKDPKKITFTKPSSHSFNCDFPPGPACTPIGNVSTPFFSKTHWIVKIKYCGNGHVDPPPPAQTPVTVTDKQ